MTAQGALGRQWTEGVHDVHPAELIPYRQHRGTTDYHRERAGGDVGELTLQLREKYGPVLFDGNHRLNAALEKDVQHVRVRVNKEH